jgi:hypothetical protein
MKKYRFKQEASVSNKLNVDGNSYLFKPYPIEYPLSDFIKKVITLYPKRFEEIITVKIEKVVSKIDEVEVIPEEIIKDVVEIAEITTEPNELEQSNIILYKYKENELDELYWRELKKIAIKENVEYTNKEDVISLLIKIIESEK